MTRGPLRLGVPILLCVVLVGVCEARAAEESLVASGSDFRSAADLPTVDRMPGWRRYKEAAFEVNVPADWFYSRDGELRTPRSMAGWAIVSLTPYLPPCEGEFGDWKVWLRYHVEGTHRKRLRVDGNPALTEERRRGAGALKWVNTYIGVEKIGWAFQFMLEVDQGNPQFPDFVKIYQQMLRSLRLHPKALADMVSGIPEGNCDEEDGEK